MKIVQINGGVFGSTGQIMFGIADLCEENGCENICISPITTTNKTRQPTHEYIPMGTFQKRRINVFLDRLTGNQNAFAKYETRKILKRIDAFNPDIVHLHNIHSGYINLKLLFHYVKKTNIKLVWTLHDCWAFTAYCPHFDMIGCEKWRRGCFHCPQRKKYSWFFDRSKKLYERKKKLFTGVKNMTLVTPSNWLAGLVKQSFLKDYPVQVIHNGIDLSIFKPTESDFKERHGLQNKKIVLGVAFGWGKAKGLDVFIELSKRLSNDYQIVLVGTDENVDKQLPKNIISIHRTQNQNELAEIYTAADVFVNPTREENYPTVNMEAIACGTPVVTFQTGGSPEIVDKTCGFVVEKGDINAMQGYIERGCKEIPFSQETCLNRAKRFDAINKFKEYVELYNIKKGKQ